MSGKVTLDLVAERIENFCKANAEAHEAILTQVKKTNGTVGSHDKWINENCKEVEGIPRVKEKMQDLENKLARYVGIAVGIGVVANLIFAFIIKKL